MGKYFHYILCIFIIINSLAAFINHIDDTDEVFGYFEPLHYILTKVGMQTWEYSPVYALRSYAFLVPPVFCAKFLYFYTNLTKIDIFIALRLLIGTWFAITESFFIDAIFHHFGQAIAIITFTLIAFSPGMFYCSTCFLPSSFCSSFIMMAIASWLHHKRVHTILWGCLAAIYTGWPFSCVLFAPFGVHMLLNLPSLSSKIVLCLHGAFTLLSVLFICSSVDVYMYNAQVSPIFNIIRYNAGSNSDNLYGVEPITYYIKNLLLTLGPCWLLSMASPFLAVYSLIRSKSELKSRGVEMYEFTLCISMLVWEILLFRRPHKEERFMYPIYPTVLLLAACSIQTISNYVACSLLLSPSSTRITKVVISSIVVFACALVGGSRIISNYNNFNGYMNVWKQAYSTISNTHFTHEATVCMGNDWYTFPSHFFLPSTAKLHFVEDGFTGLLPAHFEVENGTSIMPRAPFNDQNREEKSRYLSVFSCDYLVMHVHKRDDVNTSGSKSVLKTQMSEHSSRFELIYSSFVLDAAHSPLLSRAFYVPNYSIALNKYSEYALFKVKRN